MSEEKPKFKWGKKLGIAESFYGDIPKMTRFIELLLQCIKDTNKLHGDNCEFFRLDFRQQTLDEQILMTLPRDALVLDLKWGFKEDKKDAD